MIARRIHEIGAKELPCSLGLSSPNEKHRTQVARDASHEVRFWRTIGLAWPSQSRGLGSSQPHSPITRKAPHSSAHTAKQFWSVW